MYTGFSLGVTKLKTQDGFYIDYGDLIDAVLKDEQHLVVETQSMTTTLSALT